MRSFVRMGARFEVTNTSAVATMAASAPAPRVDREVTGHAPLATVGDLQERIGAVLAEVEHVAQRSLRVAVGRLDLDDVGAEVGQHRARRRDECPVGHLDDTDAVERTGHDSPFVLSQYGRRTGFAPRIMSPEGGGVESLGGRRVGAGAASRHRTRLVRTVPSITGRFPRVPLVAPPGPARGRGDRRTGRATRRGPRGAGPDPRAGRRRTRRGPDRAARCAVR